MAVGLDLGNLLAHLKIDASQYTRGMRDAEKLLTATSKRMTRIGRTMTMRVTAPLVAIGALATKSFVSFEEQMAMVSTMLDEQSMKYMPTYEDAIKRMSMEFGEGTKTLTKGLYDILSASVAPVKAIKVLDASVKAAKAGFTDTAVAADAITTILNSYSMAADQAGKVSDILFATVKRGKTTFAELAPSIGMVASIASTANLSFEQVGASLATMTRAGLQTRIAVTSLRAMINTFLKPTDDAKKMAETFGIELSSTTLKAMGLTGVLEKLRGATAEQLAAIMPNVRGLAGFAAALKQADNMASDLQLMLHSTGLTEEAFAKMTNTLGFELRKTWASIKILFVGIGERLAPSVEKMNRILQTSIKWFENLNDTAKDWIITIALIAASIGPVLLVAGLFIKSLALMMVAINALMASFTGLAAVIFSPFGAILLLIGIAYTLRTAWKQNLAAIQDRMQEWFNMFETGFRWLSSSVVTPFLNWFSENWRGMWDRAVERLKRFAMDFAGTIYGIRALIAGEDFAEAFVRGEEAAEKALKKIKDFVVSTYETTVLTLKAFGEASVEHLSTLVEALKTQFGKDADTLIAFIKSKIELLQKTAGIEIAGTEEIIKQFEETMERLTKAAGISRRGPEGTTREIIPQLISVSGLARGGGDFSRLEDVARQQLAEEKRHTTSLDRIARKEGLM